MEKAASYWVTAYFITTLLRGKSCEPSPDGSGILLHGLGLRYAAKDTADSRIGNESWTTLSATKK